MIIQREIEAVMLAIDELVAARIAQADARICCATTRPADEAIDKARIAIVDGLKEVIRTAVEDANPRRYARLRS